MAVEVRAASEDDLDAVVRLNKVVQDLHATLYPADFKPITDPGEVREFFQARLALAENALAVAEQDREPLGYVWFERQSRLESPFTPAIPRIHVHHICVAPEVRRQGIAAALMGHVEQYAARQGVGEISLGTWSANFDAHHFFASQGFTPFAVSLRKQL